jgi:hypothetical protein
MKKQETGVLIQRTYPIISIMRLRTSYSDAPGNKGNPIYSSATMQPKDHISMAVVYLSLVKHTNLQAKFINYAL